MKRLKHVLKILVFGVCLGILLSFIRVKLQIDTGVFMAGYWIAAGVILTGLVLYGALYMRWFGRKMREAVILLEAGETKAYIKALEKLRGQARGRFLKNLFQLNLSAGYCDLKQYAKAISILEPLSAARLRGDMQMVHRLNLCVCYFYSGQAPEAMQLYEASEAVFAPYRDRQPYGGNLAVLDMLAALERKEYEAAGAMLAEAREKWNRPRLAEDYAYIAEQLEEADRRRPSPVRT